MPHRRLWSLVLSAFGLLAFCGAASPEPIDRCGHLYIWEGCHFFKPSDAPDLSDEYVTDLISVPDSLAYGPVRVRGEVGGCGTPCSAARPCIGGSVLSRCEAVDLGCGVLHADPYDGCDTWTSELYGVVEAPLHGYSDGDTVHVAGVIDWGTPSTCQMGPVLYQETYSSCAPSAVRPKTWGTLKAIFRP